MNVSIIGHEFGADLVQVYLGKAKVPGVGVASLGDWMKQQPIVLVDAIFKPNAFAGKTHFHKPFYHFLSCLLKHGQSSVHV